ncbi:MAG: D-ribose ABC transporter substrate-binding protein [Chloroflexota bacterium]|nr:D-ribose ABC transporter substrate-binding protein [Chloroflexota bacterium]
MLRYVLAREYFFKRAFPCFVLSLLVVLGSGCQPAAVPTATPAPTEVVTRVIGVSLADLANPFFASLRDGALEAAERLGVELVIEDAAENAETQATQVQAMIEQGVAALLINPVDSDAIVSTITAANEAGIPVFTIDRSANGGEVVAHIASDNIAGGRMAGQYLAETLNNSGSVVELKGIEGTSAARDRSAGFNEAIATYPDIEIIAAPIANFNRAEAETVFAELLADNPDIDGVFAHNDEMILGAIDAARTADRLDAIAFVGFDAIDDAIDAVEAGELLATVAQQPAEIGRLGVETAVRALSGETVDASIPVDLALITR